MDALYIPLIAVVVRVGIGSGYEYFFYRLSTRAGFVFWCLRTQLSMAH